MVRSLGLACGKKALRLVEVFGRVDADGLDIGQSDLDLVAVLQPPQLLQALRQFERRLGQTRDLAQHVGTVGIEADVLEEGVGRQPLASILAPDEGDGRPGEVEGEAVVSRTILGELGLSTASMLSKRLPRVAICVAGSSKASITVRSCEGWMKGSSP